ncbi:MAG TPA: sulfatase [Myxococcota bacterium]|nr:sulfatase [Myxococcota bacterium]
MPARRPAAGAGVARRLAALVLGVPCWLACSDSSPPIACGELRAPPAPDRASVVLVVNDTMRRDRMGIHGGRARTPHFDRLARENLWFTDAVAQAPWTKPSIATLFTSLYPTQHGVVTHPAAQVRAGQEIGRRMAASDRLSPSARTLAEAARDAGFRTAAFVANPWMDRRFGFDQGFERYDDSFARWGFPGSRVMERALAWLATLDPDERYFLYVHTIDTHRPYPALTWPEVETALARPPTPGELPPPARREITQLVRLEGPRPPGAGPPPKRRVLRRAYDKGVELFDRDLGRLLRGLERDPRRDRTAVIVTSDHGEALYARGYGGHSRGLYQSELAVPLAMRLPGTREARVDCRVGLIDLMPSLCDWLGLDCPPDMAGHSVFAGLGERTAPPETYLGEASVLDPRQRTVYRGPWKLIHQPASRPEPDRPPRAWQLFHLESDPEEQQDLLRGEERSPEIVGAFRELRDALAEEVPPVADLEPGGDVEIDAKLEERLRSLGYLD